MYASFVEEDLQQNRAMSFFGDGFSNLAYPTNPVLLISLGLTVVSYPKWIRWTAKLWLWVILVTVAFLGIAVAINFGPF